MTGTFEVVKVDTEAEQPQKYKITTYKVAQDRQGNTVEIFDREETVTLEQLQIDKAERQRLLDLVEARIQAVQALV